MTADDVRDFLQWLSLIAKRLDLATIKNGEMRKGTSCVMMRASHGIPPVMDGFVSTSS